MANDNMSIEERKKLFLEKYGEAGRVSSPPAKKVAQKTQPKPKQKSMAQERRDSGHTHPSQMTPNVRVEKAYVESTISGGDSGCEEHYDLRFVKVNDSTAEERELTSLEKIMVYGDCLLYPKYKEY